MSGPLLTYAVRGAILAFLQAQLPAQLEAVSADMAAMASTHGWDEPKALDPIATWTGSPLVAAPECPAVYVLPQQSGFRGTQWATTIDEEHALYIYCEAANQDEEAAETDLMGMAAAVIRTVVLNLQQQAPIQNGLQVLFGHNSPDAENAIIFGPAQMVAALFHVNCYLPITAFTSEAT